MREVPAAAEYRNQVRRTGSILGWSLALLSGLTLVLGILMQLYRPFPDWFYGGGAELVCYALILPLMNTILAKAPELRTERKKMRIRKFLLFFVLAQGFGTLFNLAGNLVNFFFASLTGRESFGMNPVNGMLEQMDVLTVFYVCFFGPVIEEYIFRWKLLNRLRPYGEKAAILYTALMFGLMHGNLTQFLYAAAIGVILGYMAVKTGRMLYNCLLHILINSCSMALAAILLSGGPLSILLSFGSLIVMLAEIVAALVLFLVFWKETTLLPGEWPVGVTGRAVASALYCNPGTIAFFLLSLAMMLYYLFLA